MSATAVYTIAMPIGDAFDYARGALEASGAELGAQVPPGRIDFRVRRKDPDMGAIDLDMPGHATLTADGAEATTLTLAIDPAMTLFTYALGLGLAALVIGSFVFGWGALWFLIVIAAEAWLFWSLFSKWPVVVLDAIREKMQASPSVSGGAPVVQPVSPIFSSSPPSGPSANNAAAIADQIRQLATLREEGHITAEEFEAKKAELLKRI